MRPCAINFKAKLIRGFVSQERKTQHKTKLNSNNRMTHRHTDATDTQRHICTHTRDYKHTARLAACKAAELY